MCMSPEPSPAESGGIDEPLDAAVAAQDHEPQLTPQDARSRSTLRTDPDDPEAGMQAASEASTSSAPPSTDEAGEDAGSAS
jgi:hypothetical protein